MKSTDLEKMESVDALKRLLNPDSTVYAILRSKSKNGMSRTFDLIVFDEHGNDFHLSRRIAALLDLTFDQNKEGLKVRGVGTNVGLHVVSEVGRLVFGGTHKLRQVWL